MNTRHPNPNLYANEVRNRLFDYPPGFQLLPIEQQIERLSSLMGIEPVYPEPGDTRFGTLPKGTESWVAVPTLRSLRCPEPQLNLIPALSNVLLRLECSSTWRSRGVQIENNLWDGLLRAKVPDLRTRYNTHRFANHLRAFPAQLGKWRFDGKCVSPRRAQVLFDENEFGLDVVTGLVIVITHWDELKGATLRLDCSGSEFAQDGDPEKCTDTPCIIIANGAIVLDWNWDKRARGLHCTPSGWAV